MASQRTATLIGLAAILLWASLAVLTTATGTLPPFQVLAISFGVAALLGLARAALRGRSGWRELRQPWAALALSTLALFGYHALYFIALKRAPAVEANLLNYMWPLLIVVFAGLLGGVAVRGGQWAGTLLGLIAAVLLVTRGRGLQVDPAHVPGYVAALSAAVIWAAYSVLNRRFADVPTAAITVACAGVAILGGIAHLLFERTVVPDATQWIVLVVMGIGPVGAAFWLWDHGTKRGDIALLGSLSYLAPLLSTLLLVVSGRAEPHWIQAVAIALLLIGAWLSVRSSRAAR
ncbi:MULTISPECIES: DMT family transporter [unclassified Pseudoxanthomonas]|uniref:aromatic amino acid exporter YddG n=1 Tax=unclassified Pseudoxanthomonas TaxID=2645906 RepID=UPI0008E02640|nr:MULTISPECIES: DMT family transporter [unclassified Pseudoxanthomonas]PPJ42479.1 EamA/RhaT family transporter [Pseudoxanthomonas sp. KAs_5_3]SFV27159.1 EamA domain-containing membrane protein RarD [Pseudoxanthomonas sp. YR558]